jgi:hypothetical protein
MGDKNRELPPQCARMCGGKHKKRRRGKNFVAVYAAADTRSAATR